ncbi:MAG: T9SS type A sorting domain-containing protein [Chitinophagaceae bacterium]|jgi:hypothetical protein|nr:T9SS type A sorting domain-containing protein [Chitinophagaceae bacterium]OQY92813.1 MAG: hypothetical protein B6D37_13000 [Sphingobacteriales bacterium UTBCD1]
MKTKSIFSKFSFLSAKSVAVCLLLMPPVVSLATPARKKAVLTKNNPKEEVPVKKNKPASKIKASVRIYPDPVKKVLHVVARHNNGKEIDFFVFDLEGTLIVNYKMKSKDHKRITGLHKGSYVYNVFCGDTQTDGGNFEIK